MENEISLALANSIANMQKDLIVIFLNDDIIMTNDSFNRFFGVSSLQEYKEHFGDFVNNFVPHPSYFNASKINEGESWIESILKLDEIDRVVSMLNQSSEPHAYSVDIHQEFDSYKIVVFSDITQTLVKRIMIENRTNIDAATGAYAKQYFLHIKKSYEEAAVFNEKIIGLVMLEVFSANGLESQEVKNFVENFKNSTRQDDMLVKWADNLFLLALLVDDAQKATQISNKLHSILNSCSISGFSYNIKSVWQKNGESISKMLTQLSEQ